MMTFGERLSELRKGMKLTQEQLGVKLRLSKSTVAMYETGQREPNHETLILLADFFEVTTDYLLRGR